MDNNDKTKGSEALPWESEEEYKAAVPKTVEKPKEVAPKHSEAPASVTVKIKSPGGFSYMWTMRDDHSSSLMFKIREMEKKWIDAGWTAIEDRPRGGGSGFQAPPKEYVPNRQCPKCGSKLVISTTKQGAKMIKCETNKWNAMTRQAEGCSFVEWQDSYQNA